MHPMIPIFAKKYGFKGQADPQRGRELVVAEQGRIAASATTADVLAVYGRQSRCARC